jgi:diadenylate cyclase
MWTVVQSIRLRDLADIAIVAFVLYRVFLMFKGTLAVQMLAGLGLLLAARFVAREADLYSVSFILENFWAFWVLALIVLFQPELRRTLAQAGRGRLLEGLLGANSAERRQVIAEVVRAAESLAVKRIGALIVLERSSGLRQYTELGVPIDAVVSAELLGSIFQAGSPLHDGAVIIRGDRVSAAGCFLPLSRNLTLGRTLGTRHRAGLGLAEETDAAVLVVSEERGAVSLAVEGRMEPDVRPDVLASRLEALLGAGTPAARGGGVLLAGVRRLTARGKA